MMRAVVCAAAMAAALGAGIVWAADAPAAKSGQEAVEAREATMKKMGGAVKAAADAATKTADAKAKLAEAIKIAESIPAMFPKGTGPGDAGVTKTRALADIWTKPSEFKTSADNLVVALKAADAALDGGDRSVVGPTIYKACKSCHDAFRGPEVE